MFFAHRFDPIKVLPVACGYFALFFLFFVHSWGPRTEQEAHNIFTDGRQFLVVYYTLTKMPLRLLSFSVWISFIQTTYIIKYNKYYPPTWQDETTRMVSTSQMPWILMAIQSAEHPEKTK